MDVGIEVVTENSTYNFPLWAKFLNYLTILGSFLKFFGNIFKILFAPRTVEILVFLLSMWQQGDRFLYASIDEREKEL